MERRRALLSHARTLRGALDRAERPAGALAPLAGVERVMAPLRSERLAPLTAAVPGDAALAAVLRREAAPAAGAPAAPRRRAPRAPAVPAADVPPAGHGASAERALRAFSARVPGGGRAAAGILAPAAWVEAAAQDRATAAAAAPMRGEHRGRGRPARGERLGAPPVPLGGAAPSSDATHGGPAPPANGAAPIGGGAVPIGGGTHGGAALPVSGWAQGDGVTPVGGGAQGDGVTPVGGTAHRGGAAPIGGGAARGGGATPAGGTAPAAGSAPGGGTAPMAGAAPAAGAASAAGAARAAAGSGAPHELRSSPPRDPLSAALLRLDSSAGGTAGQVPAGADAGVVAAVPAAPVEGLAGLARLAAAAEADPGAPPFPAGTSEPGFASRRRRPGGAFEGPGAPRAEAAPAGFAWRLEQVLLSEARRHGITVEER